MEKFKIECKGYEGQNDIEIPISYIKYEKEFEIICDNLIDNNSFRLSYYGDGGMTISRNRCFLDVQIKPNLTPYPKFFHIYCYHSDDKDTFLHIEITQEREGFTVTSEKTIVTLSKEITSGDYDGNYLYYETVDVPITVCGGSKRFKINNISRFHKSDDTDMEDKRMEFDNGFQIMKYKNDNVNQGIRIKSYGKPFIEDDYYIIKIQHFDTRANPLEIKVNYEDNSSKSSIKKAIITPQPIKIGEIKMNYGKEVIDEEPIQEEIKEVEYKIVFDQDLTNFVIDGRIAETELPFTVMEDGEESNLLVKAKSSALWCTTKVIQEYNDNQQIVRKLILSIVNKPLSVRRSLINVTIIDKPDISFKFILTNKPSH